MEPAHVETAREAGAVREETVERVRADDVRMEAFGGPLDDAIALAGTRFEREGLEAPETSERSCFAGRRGRSSVSEVSDISMVSGLGSRRLFFVNHR